MSRCQRACARAATALFFASDGVSAARLPTPAHPASKVAASKIGTATECRRLATVPQRKCLKTSQNILLIEPPRSARPRHNANGYAKGRVAKVELSVSILKFIVNLARVASARATSVLQQRNMQKTSFVGISRHFIHFPPSRGPDSIVVAWLLVADAMDVTWPWVQAGVSAWAAPSAARSASERLVAAAPSGTDRCSR